MFKKKQPLKKRIAALKTGRDRRFYALSLRDDLSHLIGVGLEAEGIQQKDLATRTGYSESYISRLANAATNFKIGVVARVLVPLGIIPMVVDKAEWDALKAKAIRIDEEQKRARFL